MFVSDTSVLHLALPDSGPLWNVHHNLWDVHYTEHSTQPGVNAKMEQADSSFPRVNLALFFAVHITNLVRKFVVLARLNFLPVQSKYGRTEPTVTCTRCARYYRAHLAGGFRIPRATPSGNP